MIALDTVIKRLNIPLWAVNIWDPPQVVYQYDAGEPPATFPVDQVLSEHVVPSARVGCLVHWMQFFVTDPMDARQPWIYPLPADNAWWSVNINGEPLPDLNRIRLVKNGWSGIGPAYSPETMYFTPRGLTRCPIDIRFHMETSVPFALIAVAGRIVGFDFPVRYWNDDIEQRQSEKPVTRSRAARA